MSTGPGPTRKADGSPEASVDDIADLLIEGGSRPGRVEGDQPLVEGDQPLDDGLDVMLETPGPVLVSTFMPPPPSPVADDAEEKEGLEEPGEETNLAYEDLLAKLVLPAKAPEPEPAMPAVAEPLPLPLPESIAPPAPPTPPAVAFASPSSASFEISPPNDERTLVTDNPLVAEEQEAAYREGRSVSREHHPIVVQEEMRPAITEPMAAANGGAAKSRFMYLILGGSLVLFGFVLAVLFLKLIMPTSAPPAPVVIMPAPPPPPPTPPAHVEPLPPSVPPAAAAAPPAAAEPAAPAPSPQNPAPAAGEGMAPENEKVTPKARKPTSHKVAHVAAPKPTPAPKPAPAPKAAAAAPKAAPAPVVAPAAKAPKAAGGKKAKSGGYADPFDN